jgi:hypothetical protein
MMTSSSSLKKWLCIFVGCSVLTLSRTGTRIGFYNPTIDESEFYENYVAPTVGTDWTGAAKTNLGQNRKAVDKNDVTNSEHVQRKPRADKLNADKKANPPTNTYVAHYDFTSQGCRAEQ